MFVYCHIARVSINSPVVVIQVAPFSIIERIFTTATDDFSGNP
jgi:hypothetical protein